MIRFFCVLFLVSMLHADDVIGQSDLKLDSSVVISKVDTIPRHPWNNEAVLSLSYANGGIAFGLLYKRQVSEHRFFRLSLADIRFTGIRDEPYYSNQFPTRRTNFSANLTMGVEFRFKLHKLVTTYTGIDVLAGFRHYTYRVSNPSLPVREQITQDYTITAGLAFNSGVLFEVHELVKVGLNLSPDVYYWFSPWENDFGSGNIYKGKTHGVSTSFGSSSVQLLVIFRWERKPFRLKKTKV